MHIMCLSPLKTHQNVIDMIICTSSTDFEETFMVCYDPQNAIVISTTLKRLEPWVSKQSCRYRGQGSHMHLTKNACVFGPSKQHALISEMRLTTRK